MPGPADGPADGRRTAWERWQTGLTVKPTPLSDLPPPRMLLVLGHPAGHKAPGPVCWLFAHGVMPPYTPVGGSWLNLAQSPRRILMRRALDGRYPTGTDQIIAWFEAASRHWDTAPTPFGWGNWRRAGAVSARRAAAPPRRLVGLYADTAPAGPRSDLWPRSSQVTH